MKKHKKLIITFIIILVIVGLGIWVTSCVKKTTNLLSNMSNSAKTAEVEQRDIVNSISASGTITSLSSHSLTTNLSGIKVAKLNVQLGDKVTKDDIICLLDDSDLEEKLADAQFSQSTSSKLSNIEINSANRALNDAIESKQIEVSRANDEVAKAQDKVTNSENKASDAYKKYEDAYNKRVEGYKQLDEAKAQLSAFEKQAASIEGKIGELTASFTDEKDSLINYLNELIASGEEINHMDDVKNFQISVAIELSYKDIYSGKDEAIKASLKESMHSIKKYNDKYLAQNEKLVEAKANIEQASLTVSTLSKTCEGLVQSEETLKAAYESQAEAITSYKEALEQKVELRDDTVRSSDQAIQSRRDSVNSSSLNAASSQRTAEENIKTIEEQITDCQVKSPVDGIITAINIEEGQSYAGGAMVTIEDTSSYEVTAYIDEYDISKIVVGQKVLIKTNGTGDEKLEGVVKTVAPRAEKGLSAVQYKVIISVLTSNENLRLDMTAKLEIIIDEKKGVLSVPYDAIQVDEKGNFYVEVLDGGSPIDYSAIMDGTASQEDIKKLQKADSAYESHRVIITKGLESNYYVEIFSDELTAGTTIIIPSNDLFSDIGLYVDETGATGGF